MILLSTYSLGDITIEDVIHKIEHITVRRENKS